MVHTNGSTIHGLLSLPESGVVLSGGHWQVATAAVAAAATMGFIRDVISYNAIISACEKGHHWSTAMQLGGQKLPAATTIGAPQPLSRRLPWAIPWSSIDKHRIRVTENARHGEDLNTSCTNNEPPVPSLTTVNQPFIHYAWPCQFVGCTVQVTALFIQVDKWQFGGVIGKLMLVFFPKAETIWVFDT